MTSLRNKLRARLVRWLLADPVLADTLAGTKASIDGALAEAHAHLRVLEGYVSAHEQSLLSHRGWIEVLVEGHGTAGRRRVLTARFRQKMDKFMRAIRAAAKNTAADTRAEPADEEPAPQQAEG